MKISFYITKIAALTLMGLFPCSAALAQGQVYDNFDNSRIIHYGERTGVLDSAAKNPAPGTVNNSEKCGLYVRNAAKKFANIKMNVKGKLTGVEAYATYLGIPPKFKLKVYTTAPAGTLVEILIGAKRGNNDYPAGTHSQYQAYTTKSNTWEELEFKFSQIPQGSETAANQIDQIVLLFNPNSSTSDAYYFDDLTGPAIDSTAVNSTGAVGNDNTTKDAVGTNSAGTSTTATTSAVKTNTKQSTKKKVIKNQKK